MPSKGCQALEHESNHTNPNHCFAVIQSDLIVTTKPSRLVKPTEGAFYNPPLGQNLEALGSVTSTHDLQFQFAKGTKLLDPFNQCSQVAAIGPNDLQPPIHGYQELDETLGGNAVLHRRRCDHNRQNHLATAATHNPSEPHKRCR